jgi:hypothetical protein
VAALMVKEPGDRLSLREVRSRLHPLLPPPHTPLLSDEDFERVSDAVRKAAEPGTVEGRTDAGEQAEEEPADGATPLAADPGELPPELAAALSSSPPPAPPSTSQPALAPAPGPLPFDVTVRTKVRHARGAVATGIVAFLAVVFFFAAAGGGFALSRYVAGETLLPPEQQTIGPGPTESPDNEANELATRSGNAVTVKGAQGGGFDVLVPKDWVEFVEEVPDEKFVDGTQVFYVSPNGTQLLTVERLARFYTEGFTIQDYIDRLTDEEPDVSVEIADRQPLPSDGSTPEPGLALNYRSTTNAKVLVPDDPNALDQNRVTFAHLIPYAGDLWVVSVTVPIEQESAGDRLFGQIAQGFHVTG